MEGTVRRWLAQAVAHEEQRRREHEAFVTAAEAMIDDLSRDEAEAAEHKRAIRRHIWRQRVFTTVQFGCSAFISVLGVYLLVAQRGWLQLLGIVVFGLGAYGCWRFYPLVGGRRG